MPRCKLGLLAVSTLLVVACLPPCEARDVKPIRALLITGGCHDYTRQKKILSEGISARASVEWTIVQQGGTTTTAKIPIYENPNWAIGFDVVVHNECFSDAADPKWTEQIVKPHRDGVPAVVIHCAMHCYRDKTDEWFKFLGVTSHRHGANYPFEVVNLAPNNPIMRGFGESWQTPKGELYLFSKVWETATPLAHAMSRDTKQFEPCIWTNTYGKGRVFGTTIGHHNEEMSDPVFLNLMTRGLLWAAGKLDDLHLKPLSVSAASAKFQLVPENLARGQKATASSIQGNDRKAENAVDGDPQTRWCAANGDAPQWFQVDLGKPENISGCRMVWEFNGAAYRYRVEGSRDGKSWQILSDQTLSPERNQDRTHRFQAQEIRYVRLRITGLDPGRWASLYELEVFGTRIVASEADPIRTQPRGIGGDGLLKGIKVPPGFDVTLFAAPPEIRYPTCLVAAPSGELFVGIDENGSLDAKANRGRVARCIDEDGDGKADRFNIFAEMDSPRGLIYDHGTLYVLHPPLLSAFHDDDGDGVADRSETLVKGIGFDLKFRGADHTTNGIQLGIDGWIYIAVGDYGFVKAEGKDGANLQFRGGGVARVRIDGSGLEVYSRGQRNIYDVAIDPSVNVFTRDNTNDGGNWDVRLSHVIPTGQYGYPSRFRNFDDEIVQPLADYGGGSPTGSLYLQEPGFPPGFGDTLYTCDWGRSLVYRHPLEPRGAGFNAKQEPFIEMPRPTDMAVDGRSHLYISSWRDGGYTYSGPNVGYVIRVTPNGENRPTFPDLAHISNVQLLKHLESMSHVVRLHTQRELLRRPEDSVTVKGLEDLALGDGALAARVAAIFTLEQMRGRRAQAFLLGLTRRHDVREFALRALGDSREDSQSIPAKPFVDALADLNPRVRLQAAFALGRLGKREAASALVSLTADNDPLVAHVATQSLVALRAIDACLAAIGSSTSQNDVGSARALQAMHETRTVDGLLAKLDDVSDPKRRRPVLAALCRLYHREADWDGQWWGTRPDTSGPYFKAVTWSESARVGDALIRVLKSADKETARWLLTELFKHKIDLEGTSTLALDIAESDPKFRASMADVVLPRPILPPDAIRLLEAIALSETEEPALRTRVIRGLMQHRNQSLAVDSAISALAKIGAMANPPNDLFSTWQESVRDPTNARQLRRYVALAEGSDAAKGVFGYAVLLELEKAPRSSRNGSDDIRSVIERAWKTPALAARLLRAIGSTGSDRYAHQVRSSRENSDPAVRGAAFEAAKRMRLDVTIDASRTLAGKPFEVALAAVLKEKGDPALGAQLYQRQGCVSCHTTAKGETLKGPFLGDISARYSRGEIIESILKPSAKIAQGFETQKFATTSGLTYEGFVVRESGEEVEIRNSAGLVTVLAKNKIDERGKNDVSVMPNGLVDPLTPEQLASLLAYLESFRAN
jgi:putative membrane-bound dehydrogenase-like protein